MDISMLTTKMLSKGDMSLRTGEADVQVPPVVLYLHLTLGTLGHLQAIGWPELEWSVAAFAAVQNRVWHRSKAAKVWALVPV